MRYLIVPKTDYKSEPIQGNSPDDALANFAAIMDTDMHTYFEAIELPEKLDGPIVQTNIDGETIVEIYDNLLKVEFANIGEGYNGDYNPNDPEDDELIRFYVYVNANYGKDLPYDWEDVEDTSECTTIPADSNIDYLVKKATAVFNRFRKEINSYPLEESYKKLGEELSWIGNEE